MDMVVNFPGNYKVYDFHSNSLIFLGAVLNTRYFFLNICIKLKHKDLESCLSRTCLFFYLVYGYN